MSGCSRWNSADGLQETSNCYCHPGIAGGSPADASAKSSLKQAIGLLLDPFSSDSIASKVLAQLAKSGPLAGHIEQYFFDANKLKTTSIVSYGLKPLVKTTGPDSLFAIWTDTRKADIADGKNDAALVDYISFCAETINRMLVAIRRNLSSGRWTTDATAVRRVLATTYVNSFLISLRLLILLCHKLARWQQGTAASVVRCCGPV